jgi:hypothetical protein
VWSLQGQPAFEQPPGQGQWVQCEILCGRYGVVAGMVSAGKDRIGSVTESQEGGIHCEHDDVCGDRRKR